MNGTNSKAELLDTEAAAEILMMKRRTLDKLRSVGGGPAFYKLGKIFYRRDDLETWMQGRRRTSTSDTCERR